MVHLVGVAELDLSSLVLPPTEIVSGSSSGSGSSDTLLIQNRAFVDFGNGYAGMCIAASSSTVANEAMFLLDAANTRILTTVPITWNPSSDGWPVVTRSAIQLSTGKALMLACSTAGDRWQARIAEHNSGVIHLGAPVDLADPGAPVVGGRPVGISSGSLDPLPNVAAFRTEAGAVVGITVDGVPVIGRGVAVRALTISGTAITMTQNWKVLDVCFTDDEITEDFGGGGTRGVLVQRTPSANIVRVAVLNLTNLTRASSTPTDVPGPSLRAVRAEVFANLIRVVIVADSTDSTYPVKVNEYDLTGAITDTRLFSMTSVPATPDFGVGGQVGSDATVVMNGASMLLGSSAIDVTAVSDGVIKKQYRLSVTDPAVLTSYPENPQSLGQTGDYWVVHDQRPSDDGSYARYAIILGRDPEPYSLPPRTRFTSSTVNS